MMHHSEAGIAKKNGGRRMGTNDFKDAFVAMGVSSERADRALAATGYRSIALATNWLVAHSSDPTLDNPDHARVFHVYLTPRYVLTVIRMSECKTTN